ncbi:hypothetical protein HPP92_013711 [Vanilla planifolia]|uniref:Uncharacterized protein n=1 Tax=Vanilla planifolia TaxID=51239 RepID=A0A835QNY4_VANPL|nr:hypothetical protein HPP92_013711 [Vanilla planifolia]
MISNSHCRLSEVTVEGRKPIAASITGQSKLYPLYCTDFNACMIVYRKLEKQ